MAFRGLENAQFGVTMFPTDTAIGPVEIAKAVEERGLDSLFFPEHTHIPASRATPFPGGGDLPEMYWRAHDPFVALGAAAAATERIRLGTGICLVIERDPITLAKEIASLDTISGGSRGHRHRRRLEPGGDGEPRRGLQESLGSGSREGARHARDLEQRRGRVPRRVRGLRPHLVLSQAGCRTTARRSGSAPTPSGCSTASPTTATAGCRSAA